MALQISWQPSPNYSTRGTAVSGITLHWWDDPAKRPSLSGTVSWLRNPDSRVSAHYVVSDTSIIQLVSEDHAAWHGGPANASTIGIEVNPQFPGSTYATLIALCEDICRRYGLNPQTAIKGHRHWMNTACPGTLDIQRVINGVNNQPQGGEEVTREESFQRTFITVAHRWPTKAEQDAWLKSGLEDYAWVQRHAPDATVNDQLAMEIYYQASGLPVAKARDIATNHRKSGTTYKQVIGTDMKTYYLPKVARVAELEKQLSDKPAPQLSDQDKKDLDLGQKFRAVSKEANAN